VFGALKLLNEAIKAAIDKRKIRPTLGDNVPLYVNRIIMSSLFDMGTAGEGFLHHAGVHLGETLVDMGIVKGRDLKTVLKNIVEVLEKLRLGELSIVSVTNNAATIRMKECYFCLGMPSLGYGICHYENGMLTGAISKALKRKFTAQEVKCHSTGHEFCEYEIRGT